MRTPSMPSNHFLAYLTRNRHFCLGTVLAHFAAHTKGQQDNNSVIPVWFFEQQILIASAGGSKGEEAEL